MEEIIQTTIQATMQEISNYSNMSAFDWITHILSIVAIISSIACVIWTVKKGNKQTYNTSLYDDILKDDLNKTLPLLIHKSVDCSNKKVNQKEVEKLESFLLKLREKILVFKYIDLKFYEKLEKNIIDIDEKVVLISSRKEGFDRLYKELSEKVRSLYKTIEKNLFK